MKTFLVFWCLVSGASFGALVLAVRVGELICGHELRRARRFYRGLGLCAVIPPVLAGVFAAGMVAFGVKRLRKALKRHGHKETKGQSFPKFKTISSTNGHE